MIHWYHVQCSENSLVCFNFVLSSSSLIINRWKERKKLGLG